MSKEKVYIVLSHKNSLKNGSSQEWEVTEKVEFVNQLRNRHYTMSSAIADYINQKMISGSRYGFDEYSKFEFYVRKKYTKQFEELENLYKKEVSNTESKNNDELTVDRFGNVRVKTVFDV